MTMKTLLTSIKSSNAFKRYLLAATSILMLNFSGVSAAQAEQTLHKTIKVQDQDIFYREAGVHNKKTIVLLHGFPTSSHMYRDLIPKLSEQYHVIAPDYPGFGNSSMPALNEFEYSFDNLAKITDAFFGESRCRRIHHVRYGLWCTDWL